jgi:hypothetical protein
VLLVFHHVLRVQGDILAHWVRSKEEAGFKEVLDYVEQPTCTVRLVIPTIQSRSMLVITVLSHLSLAMLTRFSCSKNVSVVIPATVVYFPWLFLDGTQRQEWRQMMSLIVRQVTFVIMDQYQVQDRLFIPKD